MSITPTHLLKGIHQHQGPNTSLVIPNISHSIALRLQHRLNPQLSNSTFSSNGNSTTNTNKLISLVTTTSKVLSTSNNRTRRLSLKLQVIPMGLISRVKHLLKVPSMDQPLRCINLSIRKYTRRHRPQQT